MVYVCAKVGLNSAGEFVDYFCQSEWQWRGNFYSSLDAYYRRKLFGKIGNDRRQWHNSTIRSLFVLEWFGRIKSQTYTILSTVGNFKPTGDMTQKSHTSALLRLMWATSRRVRWKIQIKMTRIWLGAHLVPINFVQILSYVYVSRT